MLTPEIQGGTALQAADYRSRRAPYAPISALREFFERIRNVGVPARVDRRFLQKLNVANSNEWALLSALKFLGIVDEQGAPTHAYRLLQTSDRFEDTLKHLVEKAYEPLFDVGGHMMSTEDLENYFRVASSPSQAKNAARFYREVAKLAGMGSSPPTPHYATAVLEDRVNPTVESHGQDAREGASRPDGRDDSVAAKAALLEKLPALQPGWTAAEYASICASFVEMLRHLDGTA